MMSGMFISWGSWRLLSAGREDPMKRGAGGLAKASSHGAVGISGSYVCLQDGLGGLGWWSGSWFSQPHHAHFMPQNTLVAPDRRGYPSSDPEGPSRGSTSRPPFLASREVALSLDALWQEDAGPRSEAPVHTSPLGASALESS